MCFVFSAMRTRFLLSTLAAALMSAHAPVFAARTEIPRPMWLTFVEGAQREIDGEWSGGHIAVLRHATATETISDVRYPAVWRGIDARVSPAENGLKYSFDVAPLADPRAIHIRYNGAVSIELNDSGSLTIDADGTRAVATRPSAYQELNGRRVDVPVRFVPFGADVAFSVGNYDRTRPLLIESVTRR
ncbi:MAG TPA: hypothetical protein VN628_00185 [Vicinamibacterales bacterium]|nr:hypothetical protein [Vicinamibacterales bacterium]